MFGSTNKKVLSLFLSLSLLSSCIPTTSAHKQNITPVNFASKKETSNNFLTKVKSVVSNPNFIIPTAIAATVSTVLAIPYIYNTKCSKPRNPVENHVVGESDERIQYYNTFYYQYSDFSNPEFLKKYYGNNYSKEKQRRDSILGVKINEILQKMDKHGCKTDYNKALFLHDYIYDHCEYPIGTMVDLITNYKTDFDPPYSHHASGCLLDGKACCSGIAMAYALLLNSAGVKCKYIHGSASLGGASGGHAWNIVKINGHWYHVDVTFDLSFKLLHSRYKWFMLTEQEISKDHEI